MADPTPKLRHLLGIVQALARGSRAKGAREGRVQSPMSNPAAAPGISGEKSVLRFSTYLGRIPPYSAANPAAGERVKACHVNSHGQKVQMPTQTCVREARTSMPHLLS
jgi:hypothetical protein